MHAEISDSQVEELLQHYQEPPAISVKYVLLVYIHIIYIYT